MSLSNQQTSKASVKLYIQVILICAFTGLNALTHFMKQVIGTPDWVFIASQVGWMTGLNALTHFMKQVIGTPDWVFIASQVGWMTGKLFIL
uniref:DUF1097 domain-containing protein n=1 Tax=Rhabditophanes sp. KR3021 TaxID=114890 RepID=A0AC35TU14_9BILA